MNPLLHSLASQEWTQVVQALLHTLWLGGVAVAVIYFVLRRETDPAARYRWCLGALIAVVLGGIVVWAILQRRPTVAIASGAANLTLIESQSGPAAASSPMDSPDPSAAPMAGAHPGPWTPWLALVWLGGMAAMVARTSVLVAEAQKVRRMSSPLKNEALLKLLDEARCKLGLARRIQVLVTEQLTSPAVMGWVKPVLILPLSMATTLPMEQIQLILLHELAHVRRGDYLINLCQLLAESVLFFNPAVWWLSRQIRQEREACCDAMAIALVGERLQYARTLAQVAGAALDAAPAFADRRHPSGLKDRIQRLLVPGYRPALRLTWFALLLGLLGGGGLLLLTAMGARITVAAILSPRERIERIEAKMTELGEKPIPEDFNGNDENAPQVKVSGQVRTADGSPVPEWIFWVNLLSRSKRVSYGTSTSGRNGSFTNSVRAGTIFIGVDLTNFAPAVIGPLNGSTTNRFENLEIILQRGFDTRLELVDAENGRPVADAKVATIFWMDSSGLESHLWKSGADGAITLTHCADLPMDVTANVPGYEITRKRFDRVRASLPLRLELRRGAILSGVVLDKSSGSPVVNAELRLLSQSAMGDMQHFQWNDSWHALGQTDARGAFALDQLRRDMRYHIGIRASGHCAIILENISGGQSNLVVRLGPELVIHGRVIGSLDSLQIINNDFVLSHEQYVKAENHSFSDSEWVPLHTDSGVTRFQFTNRVAGLAKLTTRGGDSFEREVDGPVDDWVIDLNRTRKIEARSLPKREVIFHFTHPSGVPPIGTVSVTIPDNLDPKHLAVHDVELAVTNGEVRMQIEVGGWTSIEPKRMIGYWFDWVGERGSLRHIAVTNGTGPLVIEIPLIPAGALYAKARNADGTPAGEVFFGVSELRRAPGLGDSSPLNNFADSFSGNMPRQWVSGPLPLGGTYQVYAWQGNAFCLSKPIELTEAKPDAEIELQIPTGKSFDGAMLNAEGRPLSNAELKVAFNLGGGHTFGLQSMITDERGRFHLENCTPEPGEYSVEAIVPGVMNELVRLDFGSRPQTIHLKRGRTLGGRLVEARTGYALPNAELYASAYLRNLPMLTTRTDPSGHFEFTALGDASYTLHVPDGQLLSDKKLRADGSTNVVLRVKLHEWSKVKPKAPQSAN